MKTKIIIFIFSAGLFWNAASARAQDFSGYNPLTLDVYLEMVARGNLEYAAEKYNVSIAEAEIAVQKVLPDPELTFEGSDEGFNLELGYTIEAGKRRTRVAVARAEAEIQSLSLVWFLNELRADAAGAFFDAVMQKDLLSVKNSSWDYMAEIARYDSMRSNLGEIADIEARQSKLEARTLLNEVYRQEGEYKSAVALLNLYTGNASSPLADPVFNWNMVLNNYSLDELLQSGIENRVDLEIAGLGSELALKNLKMVKAERRPDIGIMVGYEKDWNGFFPKREMIKAGVTIPLSFSAINKGATRQANFQIARSRTQEAATELEIRTEISQAFFRYESLKKEAEEYRNGLLDDARSLLDGMDYRYRRGESDLIELLLAQRTYNEVMEQYLETMMECGLSLVELYRSAGIWNIQ